MPSNKARRAGHMRTRKSSGTWITSDPPRTNRDTRSVPWTAGDTCGGLTAGFRAHGSSNAAKMTLEERKMLRAWDNTGTTGYTVEWRDGKTCRRRMPSKESSDKYNGRTWDVCPVQPVITDDDRDVRMSYTDMVQHGIVTEE